MKLGSNSCNFGRKKLRKRSSRKRSSRKRSSRKRSSRKRSSRSFGFKYLRNDEIINSVFNNYPRNLTCDRA